MDEIVKKLGHGVRLKIGALADGYAAEFDREDLDETDLCSLAAAWRDDLYALGEEIVETATRAAANPPSPEDGVRLTGVVYTDDDGDYSYIKIIGGGKGFGVDHRFDCETVEILIRPTNPSGVTTPESPASASATADAGTDSEDGVSHLHTAAAAARSVLAARHPEQSWIVQVGEGQRVDKDRTITPRARFVQLGLQDFNGNAGAGSPRLNLPRLIRDRMKPFGCSDADMRHAAVADKQDLSPSVLTGGYFTLNAPIDAIGANGFDWGES